MRWREPPRTHLSNREIGIPSRNEGIRTRGHQCSREPSAPDKRSTLARVMQPSREKFLHGPKQDLLEGGAGELTRQTQETLLNAFPSPPGRMDARRIIEIEAQFSAAIEREFDISRISAHAGALEHFLERPLDLPSLLILHLEMMEGQPQAEPGSLRNIDVIVGRYRAPHWPLVPSLMEELMTFIRKPGDPVAKAVWAHVQFETIHPFADGNGRTGRAIILHILGRPISLSRYILGNVQEYYELFRQDEWPSWLTWTCRGIALEAQRNIAEME